MALSSISQYQILPIVPKASIYVPKVMHKPVMGGNTMSETFTHMFLLIGSQGTQDFWTTASVLAQNLNTIILSPATA